MALSNPYFLELALISSEKKLKSHSINPEKMLLV